MGRDHRCLLDPEDDACLRSMATLWLCHRHIGVAQTVDHASGEVLAALIALACSLTSGLGLVLAASASGFTQFALGYGVLFGPGAGVLFRRRRLSGCIRPEAAPREDQERPSANGMTGHTQTVARRRNRALSDQLVGAQ